MDVRVETISLQELLQEHWNGAELPIHSEEVDVVNSTRSKELKWRGLMPPQLVRRLDKGFARSNTVHAATGHALYSLCRVIQPQNVFETGTYWGYSTAYLAAALRDNTQNDQARVWTFDIYPHAGKHLPKSLRPFVHLHRGLPATEAMPPVLKNIVPELVFQDSCHDYDGVSAELNVLAPYLQRKATVLLHDFVDPQVRRAALDVLQGYRIYVLDLPDPQQLGVAIKTE